jgi:carbon storage regulator
MLVLSRKQGQSIVIANDIVVSVVHLGHGRVQIGVSAPSHMPVHREEVHRRIQSEKKSSRTAAYSTGKLTSHSSECVGAA